MPAVGRGAAPARRRRREDQEYCGRAAHRTSPAAKKTRTLSVGTVKTFAQTLRFMALSKEMIERNDFATKRDAYYQSKNWQEAKFDEQPESDTVMDDIEAMFSIHGVSREEMRRTVCGTVSSTARIIQP